MYRINLMDNRWALVHTDQAGLYYPNSTKTKWWPASPLQNFRHIFGTYAIMDHKYQINFAF